MFVARKSCKVNLSSLFASPRRAKMSVNCPTTSTLLGNAASNKVGNSTKASEKSKRSSRETKVPPKLSDYVCKTSATCPSCKTYVDTDGVVCKTCQAYWHYSCANVTQDELDTDWTGEEFLCEMHRGSLLRVIKTTTVQSESIDVTDDRANVILTNIKINPYSLNKLNQIKKKISNLDTKMVFDLKDCKKQYTIKVNSVTYQILVENLLDFAAHMAVKIKRDDVDQNGDNVKTQYNLSICNNTPCSVTFFHTTNNILVQLMKGDMKQIDDRIKNLSTFVERNFMILISDIHRIQLKIPVSQIATEICPSSDSIEPSAGTAGSKQVVLY